MVNDIELGTTPLLLDAIREFPVQEKGVINRSKLGWILKKNANRIINGYKFQQAISGGRPAWRVVIVVSPPMPPSPPLIQASAQTVLPVNIVGSAVVGTSEAADPVEVEMIDKLIAARCQNSLVRSIFGNAASLH